MSNEVFTVHLHGGLTLLVDMEDRKVDFEIVFPSGKKLSFSRTEGDRGVGQAKITADPSLLYSPPAASSSEANSPLKTGTYTDPGGGPSVLAVGHH